MFRKSDRDRPMRRCLAHVERPYQPHLNNQQTKPQITQQPLSAPKLTSMNIINNLLFISLSPTQSCLLLPQIRPINATNPTCIPFPFPLFPRHLPLSSFCPKTPPNGLIDYPFTGEGSIACLLCIQLSVWPHKRLQIAAGCKSTSSLDLGLTLRVPLKFLLRSYAHRLRRSHAHNVSSS
jgi:hypothetical protein